MPGYTIRLTDTQLTQLQTAAADNGRSIQREITHRLFGTLAETPNPGVSLSAPPVSDPVTPGPSARNRGRSQTTDSPLTSNDPDPEPPTPGGASAQGNQAEQGAVCGFNSRHHMYGKHNPCPRCGHPNT